MLTARHYELGFDPKKSTGGTVLYQRLSSSDIEEVQALTLPEAALAGVAVWLREPYVQTFEGCEETLTLQPGVYTLQSGGYKVEHLDLQRRIEGWCGVRLRLESPRLELGFFGFGKHFFTRSAAAILLPLVQPKTKGVKRVTSDMVNWELHWSFRPQAATVAKKES